MIDLVLQTTSGDVALVPGSQPVLFVHEIGAPAQARTAMQAWAQREWQAWTYSQRGHGPSPWLLGGYYSLSTFSIDLIRVLDRIADQPMVLAAQGASGLVATLVAVARPELVAGIEILGSDNGWLAKPSLLVSDEVLPNPEWVRTLNSSDERDPVLAGDEEADDPLLLLGPPHSLRADVIRETLAMMHRPWHSALDSWAHDWLPRHGFKETSFFSADSSLNDSETSRTTIPLRG